MANRHAKGRLMGGSLFRETLRTDPLEKANEESGLEWGTRQSQDTPPYLPAKAAVKGGRQQALDRGRCDALLPSTRPRAPYFLSIQKSACSWAASSSSSGPTISVGRWPAAKTMSQGRSSVGFSSWAPVWAFSAFSVWP